MSYLDDTSRCPCGRMCESCGATGELTVATATTPVGVLCLTLCARCVGAASLPSITSWSTAVRLVGQHAAHLGIDVDEMAAEMERPAR